MFDYDDSPTKVFCEAQDSLYEISRWLQQNSQKLTDHQLAILQQEAADVFEFASGYIGSMLPNGSRYDIDELQAKIAETRDWQHKEEGSSRKERLGNRDYQRSMSNPYEVEEE